MTGGVALIIGGAAHSLASVSLRPLLVAVILHLFKLAAEARAWHGIVSGAHDGMTMRFRTTLGAFVGSIGLNAILPARVGEALRVGVVRGRIEDSSVGVLAGTIVFETLIEVVFGLAVITAVLTSGQPFGMARSPLATIAGLAGRPIVLTVVLLSAAVLAAASWRHRKWLRRGFMHVAQGFTVARSPRQLVWQVLVWKLVAWSLRLATVYAFLLAFHLPASPSAAVVVVCAQNLAATIPLLPGNAGTQQAALALALAGTASSSGVLGFGVGMQASTAITDVAIGALAIALVATRGELRGALTAIRRSSNKSLQLDSAKRA